MSRHTQSPLLFVITLLAMTEIPNLLRGLTALDLKTLAKKAFT